MRLVVVVMVLSGCDWILDLHHLDTGQEPVAGHWVQVAAGDHFTCAIDDTNQLFCWGQNGDHQLGTGRDDYELDTPTVVPGGWRFVATGEIHACGIKATDSSLWCWGSNFTGQLGINSKADSPIPAQVGTDAWSSVATFSYHTCGIATSGALYCWGINDHGETGSGVVGTAQVSPQPVTVSGVSSWLEVATGPNHTCAIADGGTAYCWGANWDGQLGSPAGPSSVMPVTVPGVWAKIAVGDDWTCAVDTKKAISCWGNNDVGSLGNGGTSSASNPSQISSNTQFVDVKAGWSHTCGLATDGTVECWGDPSATSFAAGSKATSPQRLLGGAPIWTALAIGRTHMCGIGTIHDLWCVGDGSMGQLANGSGATTASTKLTTIAHVKEFATGEVSTCAVDTAGKLRCWGDNDRGELGTGDQLRSIVPSAVAGADISFAHLSVGFHHGCALDTAMLNAYCWGENGYGQLGDNTTGTRLMPTLTNGGNIYTSIIAGGYHTCARNFSQVYCWGRNVEGQLGLGNTTDKHSPTPLPGSTSNFTGLAAGYLFTCVLDASHDLQCTGLNQVGQLGTGDLTSTTSLTINGFGIPVFTMMSAGYEHACGEEIDMQHVQCWGRDYEGQVGDSGSGVVLAAKRVIAPVDFTAVAAGRHHSCAIDSNKHVWCWGRNDRGQLGTGNLASSPVPIQVTGDVAAANVVELHAGNEFTCAVDDNGDMYCWGDNGFGQLGTGAGWTSTFAQVASP